MPSIYAVVEIDLGTPDYDHVRLHKLILPSWDEPGFYRQQVSHEAFFEHVVSSTGHFRSFRKGIVAYVPKPWDEFGAECERLLKFGFDDRALPLVEHIGIWDFYTYIRYDYKKQRFLQ